MTAAAILAEVAAERARQDARWGEQNHPDGTGPNVPLCYFPKLPSMADLAVNARTVTNLRAKRGDVTWLDILLEEVFEALELTDTAKLRAELIQVAAVAGAWAEAIDRRNHDGGTT